MNEHFGVPGSYGHVITGIWLDGAVDAASLLRAIETRLRESVREPRLVEWRRQLLNMRYRAWLEDWGGWA